MKKLVKPFALILLVLLFTVCKEENSGSRGLRTEQEIETQTRTVVSVGSSEDREKYALVIGNGVYTGINKLNNAVNYARVMGAALKELGFTVELIETGICCS